MALLLSLRPHFNLATHRPLQLIAFMGVRPRERLCRSEFDTRGQLAYGFAPR